jgi:hypothetical protein
MSNGTSSVTPSVVNPPISMADPKLINGIILALYSFGILLNFLGIYLLVALKRKAMKNQRVLLVRLVIGRSFATRR